MASRHIVFVHGWALNSGVWGDFTRTLGEQYPDITTQCIDLPGYGTQAGIEGVSSIESMAQHCLDQLDRPAIWVGWSLGGMVAMQAARMNPVVVEAMQLICTSPKFVADNDWPEGVSLDNFKLFSKQLAEDYQRTLTLFLLMQAGSSRGARDLAKSAHNAICQWPDPSKITLNRGIECLAQADLRAQIEHLSMPAQVVSGLKDRVSKPESSARLAQILGADLVELDTGHAPFMTQPKAVLLALLDLIESSENEVIRESR